jgi:hypothetical protein
VPFACSICEQESTRICVFCTKDACNIHICGRCGCCSDCCPCEVPLNEPVRASAPEVTQSISASLPELAEVGPEISLATELEAELTELDMAELNAEFAPGGEPGTATPGRWNSADSQSTASEEPDAEPSETPKV